MKTLLVYYSRTDVTKKIAKMIQEKINCDIEEITDDDKYSGKLGFLKGGMNASMGRTSDINIISKNPTDYDLIIIGTPVWASNIATPIYTYLMKYNKDFKNVASFCTCMGNGYEKTLKNISEITGKEQISTMFFTAEDIKNPEEKINIFINEIK
ncbi:Flavodoxin [Methanobrevibacter gottschalkii]|uniref:Flavodoxin n=2 Tax=Methanobrevibacter gottschalkii TaxID=190974 RepID=A0A3N5AZT8_9EURY|nr:MULTISPECIES: flavodoxin [Methanobrevibacter]MCQ2970502.1 flavodoxin [archaeon]OEC99593.1 flavodoxin [Methanobrevibacter sp. A27]RPF50517.1 flavodoxin [Methanobrevibacter gottschalkii DSM 11977]SEK89244.1 Flavodoxin [Methanobrevibacter gottschalkii]